jgi:hypothetical protein
MENPMSSGIVAALAASLLVNADGVFAPFSPRVP